MHPPGTPFPGPAAAAAEPALWLRPRCRGAHWDRLYEGRTSAWRCWGATLYAEHDAQALLVLGAIGDTPASLYVFHVATGAWSRADMRGLAPAPAPTHALFVAGDAVVCLWSAPELPTIGPFAAAAPPRDAHPMFRHAKPFHVPATVCVSVMALSTMCWSPATVEGPAPSMRSHFSATRSATRLPQCPPTANQTWSAGYASPVCQFSR